MALLGILVMTLDMYHMAKGNKTTFMHELPTVGGLGRCKGRVRRHFWFIMAAAGVTFKILGAGYYEAVEVTYYTYLPLSATVLDLKKNIASFYRIPVERQILRCIEAEDLQDDRTIESYHFDRNNHVNVLVMAAKLPTPAPVEKSNIEMKEGEKNTDDDAKDEITDIQVNQAEKNIDASFEEDY